jgi:hypothetical protein
MKLNKHLTIIEIRKKLLELNLPALQQFENYNNQELIMVCRMFNVAPFYDV